MLKTFRNIIKTFIYKKMKNFIMSEREILLKRVIADLKKISGVKGCLVTTAEGNIVVSDISNDVNEEELGAITVFTASLGSEMDTDFNLGNLERVVIEGSDYKILSFSLGELYVGIVTEANVSISSISKEIEAAAEKIKEVV